jgi:ATP-dependent Lon protease
VKTVIIPEENAKELVEIPDEVKNTLEIIPVSLVDDVIKIALTRVPEPIEWDEKAAAEAASVSGKDDSGTGVTAH